MNIFSRVLGRALPVFGISCTLLLSGGTALAQKIRIVAANISSGNNQSYDSGEGARIFEGLHPDVVMIQEFNVGGNTTSEVRAFVTNTFGSTFSYYRQAVADNPTPPSGQPSTYNIPNGIISRYPILASGTWDDPELTDRDFAWARIDIPGSKDLWIVSVHVKSSSGTTNSTRRENEAVALKNYITANVPTTDYLAIGGDFNAYSRSEDQFTTLSAVVRTTGPYPNDKSTTDTSTRVANEDTNANRNDPYDNVFPDADLYALQVPVVVGTQTFANGLVFDTRVFSPISDASPALATDSAATNMQHMAVARDFQLPTATPPTISTTSPLAGGTVGAAYSQTFAATSGTSPYTWTVSSGTLPTSLALSSAGVLSGTPGAAGTYTFTVQVADSASSTATKSISVTINPALTIPTVSPLAGGTVGTAYSQTLASTGDISLHLRRSSAPFPPALSLVARVRFPERQTASGTFTFTARVADGAGAAATKSISVTITPTLTVSTSSPLAGGTVGTAYSQTLAATGGTSPYAWTVSSGTLPTSLSLSGAGVLSGTPTASGTFTFTARVADNASAAATKSISVTITPALTVSTSSPLAGGTVGTAYSQTLAATGGTSPYTWTVSSGTLPTSLALSGAGVLSGTPTVSGTFTFTAQAADGASAVATKAISVTITPILAVSTFSPLAGGTVGTAYSQTLAATGGTSPYTWTVSSGTVPTGLSLGNTGVLSGTPTSSGTFTFTARVADNASAAATKSISVTITPTLAISSSSSLAGGTVGSAYSQALAASGGSYPYSWSVSSGPLPASLTLSATGVLSGTPTAAGSFTFTAHVADSASAVADKSFSVTITPTLAIASAPALPAGTVGSIYSQSLQASGGTSPYVWSLVSGNLPDGVTLDSSGTLAGTPTGSGNFAFTAQVADNAGASVPKSLSLTITPTLAIASTSPLPGGLAGTPYSQTLSATGGTSPYSWSVSNGTLPSEITLNADGTITGTSAQSGTFQFTAHLADAAGASVNRTFGITITPALAITSSPTLAGGVVGAAYSQSLASSGGTGPYTWSIVTGSLPDGLTLAADGTLAGTPTTPASSQFTARVSDNAGTTADQSFTLAVQQPLAAYLAAHGLAIDSGALDSDGDGIPNLLEFVLGGDPTQADPSIAPKLSVDAANGVLNYTFTAPNNTGSVAWKLQSSADLLTWTEVAPGLVLVTPGANGTQQVTLSMPMPAQGVVFLRLLAAEP